MALASRVLRSWKKIAVVILIAAVIVIAHSLLYNSPIRFWPKYSHVLHVSSAKPENIVLSPTRDMATMVAVNWRTSDAVSRGTVEFFADNNGLPGRRPAVARLLFSRELRWDEATFCHSAVIDGLDPGTTYFWHIRFSA